MSLPGTVCQEFTKWFPSSEFFAFTLVIVLCDTFEYIHMHRKI